MGPVEIDGLPAHVLIVHAVVVLIPAAALCVLLSAWWPRARRWLGVLTPIAALAALALVPVTTNAGEWLAERLGATPLIARHEELGEQMIWWVGGLFAVALVQWAWHRWYADAPARSRTERDSELVGAGSPAAGAAERLELDGRSNRGAGTGTRGTVVSVLIGLVATAVAVGSVVHVVRVGESGSRAVWEGSYSSESR